MSWHEHQAGQVVLALARMSWHRQPLDQNCRTNTKQVACLWHEHQALVSSRLMFGPSTRLANTMSWHEEVGRMSLTTRLAACLGKRTPRLVAYAQAPSWHERLAGCMPLHEHQARMSWHDNQAGHMSWHDARGSGRPTCLGTNARLAATSGWPACLGTTTRLAACLGKNKQAGQHVLAHAPGHQVSWHASMSWHEHHAGARAPGQHVLARARGWPLARAPGWPACPGTSASPNTSLASMSWHEHQADQHVVTRCLGTDTKLSWHEHQAGRGRTSWHERPGGRMSGR